MATVLIVDRDFGTRTRLTELLMAGGYDVQAVVDGMAGIDVLSPDLPSAVLLSLQSDGTSTQSLLYGDKAIRPCRSRSRSRAGY